MTCVIIFSPFLRKTACHPANETVYKKMFSILMKWPKRHAPEPPLTQGRLEYGAMNDMRCPKTSL